MLDNLLKKPKIVILSFKKNLLSIVFCLFTIFLIIFSNQNLDAAKNGLTLWANNIVPSLFPFFIAIELLNQTTIIQVLEKVLNPIMRPLFNVPGSGSFPLLMGIISGYPTGAKIVANFRQNNICSKEECERLLSFTNNSGPLFILGTVGVGFFLNSLIGVLLLITHILSCITVGIIFRFWKYKPNLSYNNYEKNYKKKSNNKESIIYFSNLGEILSKSIISSINMILMIGGFVVVFSIILSILENTNIIGFLSIILKPLFIFFNVNNTEFINGFLKGIIELTNGLNVICNIPSKYISTNIILTSILLGFGGFSVLLQVYSIISKTDLSIKPYIIGKILQAIISGIYTYIFIKCFPIFNLNLSI